MFDMKSNVKHSIQIIVILAIFESYYATANTDKNPDLIYILLWSGLNTNPFKFWSPKQKSLQLYNCQFQNCYIIKDRKYFNDVTDYDAILFNVISLKDDDLPLARTDNQLYVFVSVESPIRFPFHEQWNWFFNYTWTYKLDSDIIHPYFIVRNKRGQVVGPKINPRWINMTKIRSTLDTVKYKLRNKNTAAVWFLSNCHKPSKRLAYGHKLSKTLSKYNMNIDIYGTCGNTKCPKGTFEQCLKLIESRYYFYLAFENSNHEDYVTDTLLAALRYYAVPVVLGGANYSRFMPEGIYLNGKTLSVDEVAGNIKEALENKEKYYDYFKWRQYYTYDFARGTGDDSLCTFCALLNNGVKNKERRAYNHIDKWWNEYRSQNEEKDFFTVYGHLHNTYNLQHTTYNLQTDLQHRSTSEMVVETATQESSLFDAINDFFQNLFRD